MIESCTRLKLSIIHNSLIAYGMTPMKDLIGRLTIFAPCYYELRTLFPEHGSLNLCLVAVVFCDVELRIYTSVVVRSIRVGR